MDKYLFVEPFNFGSHKFFAKQILRHSRLEIVTHFGSDPSWKWAMRFSGINCHKFIQNATHASEIRAVLCSNYLNLEFLKMDATFPPVVMYHHENQFAYPRQTHQSHDFNFTIIEMINLQLAEKHIFNSQWNLDSTVEGWRKARRRLPAAYRKLFSDHWIERSCVVYPGIESLRPPVLTETKVAESVIIWNHRWDHDKNPELFYRQLCCLREQPFRLILLGEQRTDIHPIFKRISQEFSDKIIAQGYVQSRHQYLHYLQIADICISTAEHEFFGMSVMEAFQAGCKLILPRKLSYPELFSDEEVYFWHNEQELSATLRQQLGSKKKRSYRQLKSEWRCQNSARLIDDILENAD